MSNISRQARLAPWCLFLLQRAVGIVIRARLEPTGSEVHLRVCVVVLPPKHYYLLQAIKLLNY
jgi:hypothetical protein